MASHSSLEASSQKTKIKNPLHPPHPTPLSTHAPPTPPVAGRETRVLLQVPVLPSNWLAEYNWGWMCWRFNTIYGGVSVFKQYVNVSACIGVSVGAKGTSVRGMCGHVWTVCKCVTGFNIKIVIKEDFSWIKDSWKTLDFTTSVIIFPKSNEVLYYIVKVG